MRSLLAALATFCAFICMFPLRAEEPRWNVMAECQMIILPQKAALALLPELQDETKIEAAYAKLQAMIEHGEATLAAQLVARTTDGEKTGVESTEEVRYPTEFDPPQVPESIPLDKPDILKDWPVVGVTPTAFEIHSIGTTLEIEPHVLNEGRALSVHVVPMHTRLLHWKRFDAGRLPNGERLSIEQPQFSTMKNTSTVLLRNGQRILLGIHKVPDNPDAVELFLFKVSATAAP